jgi:lysozyme
MITGIDISHWQGSINWAKVSSQVKFAILKCSEGTNYRDDTYKTNKAGCANNGIPHGAYHFFRSNADPIDQAEIFYEWGNDSSMKFWCVDVEANNGGNIRYVLQTMLQKLEQLTGRVPWIYTAKYFWNANIGAQSWASRCPLWVANYSVTQPTLPAGWSKWGVWQYSSHGTIAGISGNVDMNIFNDNDYDLNAVFGNGSSQPPPPPQPLPDKVRTTAQFLNIRSSPGGALCGYVPYRTIFGVNGQALDANGKKWWKIGAAYIASWYTEII